MREINFVKTLKMIMGKVRRIKERLLKAVLNVSNQTRSAIAALAVFTGRMKGGTT